MAEQPVICLPPVDVARFLHKRVVGRAVAEHTARVDELLLIVTHAVHVRPNRNHHARAQLMQLRGQLVRVGEARQVERLLSPLAVLPGQPVLNYEPERDAPSAVLLDYRDKLVGAFVALFRLTVAVSPLRQQRRASGQQTVAAVYIADVSAGDEVVIELVDRVAPDVLADLGILEGHERPAVEQEAISLGRYE